MRLRSISRPARPISLVSMIDVLLIMLVFFMVTSTYLDLDMIPVAKPADGGAVTGTADVVAPLVIRLGADGTAHVRGRPVDPAELAALVNPPGAARPVTILPSLRADTQSLVGLIDALTLAGVVQLRVLRVDSP